MSNFSIHIVRSDSPYLQEFSMERHGTDARSFRSFSEINVALRIATLNIPAGSCCETVYLINHNRKIFQGSFHLQHINDMQAYSNSLCLLEDFRKNLNNDTNKNSFGYTPEKSEKAREWLSCIDEFN